MRPILAARVGGRRVFGDFPYFDAAFLGGRESVRTIRRQRYAGDAAVFGSLELRIPVAEFPLVFPLSTGVLGFVDAGRVYLDGDSPGNWHTGAGAGIWVGLLKPSTSLTLTWTNSRDRRMLLGTGFAF
jgi:hemolysin activation/secretion protein